MKNLLSFNPDSKTPIRMIELSPIPRFSANHSLFSIFHEFKTGKSHMGLVVDKIDQRIQPIGIITFEDLIEELVQQEIADETDEVVTKFIFISITAIFR